MLCSLALRLSVRASDRHAGASEHMDEACLWMQITEAPRSDGMSRLGQPCVHTQ